MDITLILLTLVGFIVGAAVTFFFKGNSNQEVTNTLEELKKENKNLSQKLNEKNQELTHKVEETKQEYNHKSLEIKDKYEQLLKEANSQVEKLDGQLKNVLNGNIDEAIKADLAEVSKLKKKIKDLEENLEDYEDDISNLKKKLRNKNEDLQNTQESLLSEQKESKRLAGEIANLQQRLEEKVNELNLKMGSIEFIQEILSAKEINTADTKALYKGIDYFESFIKGQFIDVNTFLFSTYDLTFKDVGGKEGRLALKKHFFDSFEEWASTKRKSWLDGKTTIAFVGEFSAGKTSIVNRILSQDNPSIPLLPVSTKATTAIPTYIAGGPSISYSFISGDGKQKTILENTFKKVSKEVLDQIKGISSLIKYFVMTYKNPNLDGLSILDTPGFNSNDKEDRERTISVINECDALFWVFDVNAGTINRSSISIIKERLNKPLYVVINKVDTKSASEVKNVEDLIRKTLTDEGLKVESFIRFSSKEPLENIMKPIKCVNRIASRDTYVEDVKEFLVNMKELMESHVSEDTNIYNQEFQEANELTDEFIDCMRSMQEDCEEANNIPHWETHIFSSDRYEMTENEGNQLRTLLEQIACERVSDLATKFDERVEKAEEVQQAWSNLCDSKASWQKVEDCIKQFNKVIKKFK